MDSKSLSPVTIISLQPQSLALRGELDREAPVACSLAAPSQSAAELSLAENVVRVATHPADQFAAWAALIDQVASVTSIAERFDVSEPTVAKRLSLNACPRRKILFHSNQENRPQTAFP